MIIPSKFLGRNHWKAQSGLLLIPRHNIKIGQLADEVKGNVIISNLEQERKEEKTVFNLTVIS